MPSTRKALTLAILAAFLCATAVSAAKAPRVLFLLPKVQYMYLPHWMIGDELFPVVDELEAHGVVVEFTSPQAAVYPIPVDEAEQVIREVAVETPSDEIDLSRYEIVAIAGGHVHQYLTVLVEPNASLLHEAYARGMTLAGMSQGALVLNDSGLLSGRTIARCPWGHGIVYCHNSIPAFEKAGTRISRSECLVVSNEIPGESTIITATHDCKIAFAHAILEDLGLLDPDAE